MRTPAKVQEIACPVDAHLVALDLVGDQLQLVVLAALAKLGHRLIARERLVDERPVLVDDAAHPRLDRAEVRLGNGLGEREVVVEAVLHGRANAVFRVGVQLHDCCREEVRGRVPQNLQRIISRLVLSVVAHRVVQYMDALYRLESPPTLTLPLAREGNLP